VKQRPVAPAGSFAVGAMALQRRVRDELGLDYTLGQVETLASGEVQRIGDLLKKATARFGRNQSAEQILAKGRREWKREKPLLELYRDEITDEEKLAEQQQLYRLGLTYAYEVYPFHHLQFVTANRHPRKWRRLFAHAVFYEGWTLWCEQMVVDLKIERSPWLLVQQLHDALWRCHRILVDLRLQTGRYSYEQAVSHMQKHLGFTKARAQADVTCNTVSAAETRK
jgi:hypothetical protein